MGWEGRCGGGEGSGAFKIIPPHVGTQNIAHFENHVLHNLGKKFGETKTLTSLFITFYTF